MKPRVQTDADTHIRKCIGDARSFALIAGAGSGKTTSLVDALGEIRIKSSGTLRQNAQRVACITYTKRAVEVVRDRLGPDDLYFVGTLHSFLWGEIGRFQHDIREGLRNSRIPALIAKAKEKDNGGQSQQARQAREQIARLEIDLASLDAVATFKYDDTPYGDYQAGVLGHDDVVEIAVHLLASSATFRRLIGQRYPYIFVDEAQDTFPGIVSGINGACAGTGLPLVGYFGDPWQQIYDNRAGQFEPPEGGLVITKTENFRCSLAVVTFLNSFRKDVTQYAAGDNKAVAGSVLFRLVEAENPALPRKRYSDDQLSRALAKYDRAIADWGWDKRNDVIRLFLVRQMIARRLGFSALNQLFTGEFASQRGQQDYEAGEHYVLKPFVNVLWPLVVATRDDDTRRAIDILSLHSPAFGVDGPNQDRSLAEMIKESKRKLVMLSELWNAGTTKEILELARDEGLVRLPEFVNDQLVRPPRAEQYNDELNAAEKGDWLCDAFFSMKAGELGPYCDFVVSNTAFSTQHGVKGEEYPNVLVVFDDVEASWSNYSFTKLLSPASAGAPTEGQRERGKRLAYVCFSRALENLRVLFFTTTPDAARDELVGSGLLTKEQIELVRM